MVRGLWIGLLSLAGLTLIVLATIYGGSEWLIRRNHPLSPEPLVAAADLGAVERGARLATVMGCHDCHGAEMTGRLFFDEPRIARLAGPNLTLLVPRQTDADLARAIRRGVAADGRALWIMPSDAFARLSDAEAADLLAYLRSLKPHGAPQPAKSVGLVGRLGILVGKFPSAPQAIVLGRNLAPVDLGPQFAQGRALSRACTECHGLDLKGAPVAEAPDLTIAGSYDLPDFARLLRTGVATGNRRVGLMSDTAPRRFHDLTDPEIAALHAYLRARAEALNRS